MATSKQTRVAKADVRKAQKAAGAKQTGWSTMGRAELARRLGEH